MMYASNTKKDRGFSLLEVIITVSIFSVLSLAVSSTIVLFYKSNQERVAQSAEVQSASRALKSAVRDFREATYADNGAFPILEASAHEVTFYSDIDKDDSEELVTYVLDGTNLMREVTNPTGNPPTYPGTPNETTLISEYVRNIAQSQSTFIYYDTDGNVISGSDVAEIASIQFQVIVNIDPNAAPGSFKISSRATLRNLKTNL